jgi:hypothetical protein
MSPTGYAVPPLLRDGPELRSLIEERRTQMPLIERHRPECSSTSPKWCHVFQVERDVEDARSVGPDAGRWTWWYGRDVDMTLAAYGYRPRIYGVDPPRWPVYFPQAHGMAPSPTRAPPAGIGKLALLFIGIWWPTALRTVREAIQRRRHPRETDASPPHRPSGWHR